MSFYGPTRHHARQYSPQQGLGRRSWAERLGDLHARGSFHKVGGRQYTDLRKLYNPYSQGVPYHFGKPTSLVAIFLSKKLLTAVVLTLVRGWSQVQCG